MLFLLLQKPKQQRHAPVVVLQKLIDLPMGVLQGMMVSGEPNDSIKKGFVAERNARQGHPEEVVRVRDHAVVVVRDVFTEIAEVELDFRRKR